MPFEYYNFHTFWTTLSIPVYFKDIDIPVDFLNVILYSKRAGKKKPFWKEDLGRLTSGIWRFSVSLEGNLFYSKVGESPRQIGDYPIVHPIQEAIRDARQLRLKSVQEDMEKKKSDLDWTIQMMNEN